MVKVINTTDLMPPDWRFLQDQMPHQDIAWSTFTSQAYHGAARMNRFRVGFGATAQARQAARADQKALLVSHLPNMAGITNLARKLRSPSVPQIAFAFNFTALPQGAHRSFYRTALKGIDEFVVFSTYEQELYADWLGLPPEKIHFMRWAMEAPAVLPSPAENTPDVPYLCSIGGEARHYALLAEAMRHLPKRRAVIIARPYSIEGIEFPDNVDIRLNLPAPETWRLASDAVGLALPLLTDKTVCGHVTFVAAQLLGLPLVVTNSVGLADYVSSETVFAQTPAGDVDAMTDAIEQLFLVPQAARAIADHAQQKARQDYALSHWTDYLEAAIARLT